MQVKKFLQKLFLKSYRNTLGKTYSKFDEIPAKNWFKYFETKDLDYFVISGTPTEIQKEKSFELLFNQQIKLFGLSDEFKRYFSLQKKILKLKIDYAITKKKHLQFHIDIKEKQLNQSNPTSADNINYLDLVARIEDVKNRSIDENTISAEKFYTYLNQMK